MNVPAKIKQARKVSTPIISVTTPDQSATARAIAEAFNGNAPAVVTWDCVRGVLPLNKQGTDLLIEASVDGGELVNPVEAMRSVVGRCVDKLVFVVFNAQDWLGEPEVRQAVSNLRDHMSSNRQTIILLAPSLDLPESMQHDVMMLDEPLPDAAVIQDIVSDTVEAAKAEYPDIDGGDPAEVAKSLAGLSAFEVEQATALCIEEHRAVKPAVLSERRNGFVENAQGLSVDKFGLTFDDVKGISRARWFGERLCSGPEKPAVIIRIDEIEKAMGGGDDARGMQTSSSTQGDELGVLLTAMEDNEWSGVLAYGHPGTGKTLWTRTLGPTFDIPTLVLDIAGTRGKYVGESEKNIRAAMKVAKAIGGKDVYVMATCNELDSLKPELKRRFTDSVFFFGLPSPDELADLWKLYAKKYGVKVDKKINDKGWTGAEIRNACRMAHRLQIPVSEAAKEVIPISKSDPASIERRCKRANKRFRDASKAGVYLMEEADVENTPSGRKFEG